ncbi:hypothetical protein LTR09_003863 [Extremus antarcticus]|uniref:Survival Motor Neuron Gemin2-binding domain-containing protein n=1 Tax=Extremus antarcticus TaxID=702011 RepID=A0AAJ0DRH5_9PEZI|nr:hypothetical protein LTR09_003863 [Extremus antarcticus]
MSGAAIQHTEVWDDSALVNSWNEAFEEYKKYHSLAVKGEKVDLAAENAKRALVNGVVETQAAAEEDVSATLPGASSTSRITNNVARAEQTAVSAQQAAAVSNGAATLPIPQALMATVNDGDMKNLMMSWYYAGYYTGLYEGKQQGYALAQVQQQPG